MQSVRQLDLDKPPAAEVGGWEAKARVYFLWVAFERRVYCKVGSSVNPVARLRQLQTGLPEAPFRIHMLPCLSTEQARLIEGKLHANLAAYRSKGEWFADLNFMRLTRAIGEQINEILYLFQTFGYDNILEEIELSGRYPVLTRTGFVYGVVE